MRRIAACLCVPRALSRVEMAKLSDVFISDIFAQRQQTTNSIVNDIELQPFVSFRVIVQGNNKVM